MDTVYIGNRGIVALLREAGFTEDRTVGIGDVRLTPLEAAFCVVKGESGGDPWSINTNRESEKPVKGWFPGGYSHDCGLIQWNDYWWGADDTTDLYNPDRVAWYTDAFNPRTAVKWLYAHTDGGVRNWSTWLAVTNDSFLDHAAKAKATILLPPPDPFRPITIGGRTWVRASSIAARCNPGVSTERWFRFNATVRGPKGEAIDLRNDRNRLLQPGTTIRVPFWTTRIQAGPLLPDFAR